MVDGAGAQGNAEDGQSVRRSGLRLRLCAAIRPEDRSRCVRSTDADWVVVLIKLRELPIHVDYAIRRIGCGCVGGPSAAIVAFQCRRRGTVLAKANGNGHDRAVRGGPVSRCVPAGDDEDHKSKEEHDPREFREERRRPSSLKFFIHLL